MYNLSTLYDVGLGLEKNTEKSIALGNELISMDISYGYAHLGSIHSTGLGVPKYMKKAESYLYEAAIRGHARMQTYLGNRLIFKHKNRDAEGVHLLECALQQEHWEAANKLSAYYHYVKGNFRKSLEYLLIGIKNGNESAITSLSLEYVGDEGLFKQAHPEKRKCLQELRRELTLDPATKFSDVEIR